MLRRTITSFLMFALVVGSSSFVPAQAPAKPKGTTVKLDATIDQVVPQGILATSKDGKSKYAIGFSPASKVGLVGNASVDFLEPGMFVQMVVEMDGEVKPLKEKEVTQVTIIAPSKLNEPGVMAKKGPDQVAGEPGPYIVRGTVRTNKDNQLTVNAGSKQVTVTMALTATVPVNIPNWQMAKTGDAITGAGIVVTAASGNAPAMVFGDSIEIKAAMPITKPGKK